MTTTEMNLNQKIEIQNKLINKIFWSNDKSDYHEDCKCLKLNENYFKEVVIFDIAPKLPLLVTPNDNLVTIRHFSYKEWLEILEE